MTAPREDRAGERELPKRPIGQSREEIQAEENVDFSPQVDDPVQDGDFLIGDE